jgi:hypothetical protein
LFLKFFCLVTFLNAANAALFLLRFLVVLAKDCDYKVVSGNPKDRAAPKSPLPFYE